MNRLVPGIFVILLVSGMGIFSIYEYNQNVTLQRENTELKAQNQQLQSDLDLSKTTITQLEQNATALQRQLKRHSYIAIALLFLWNPNLNVNVEHIQETVTWMNQEWDSLGIFFVIVAAQPEEFMPLDDNCRRTTLASWGSKAHLFYPENDIPIGIFRSVGQSNPACTSMSYIMVDGIAYAFLDDNAFTKNFFIWPWNLTRAGRVLGHELVHIFGFTDDEIRAHPEMQSGSVPLEWQERLRQNAKLFDLPASDPLRN